MDDAILAFLGRVVAYGGGGAVVAYGLFVFLGRSWIESTFAQRLATLKHKQDKELEDLKYQINSLLSRVAKIHHKEFEVLTEAWARLQDAIGRLASFVSPYQQYPNLERITEGELEQFLSGCDLDDYEKTELRSRGESNRNAYYQDRIFWHHLSAARRVCTEFHVHIRRNRIFLSKELKDAFTKIDSILWESAVSRQIAQESGERKIWIEASERMKKEVEPLMKEIEDLVQEKLKYEQAG